MSNLQSRAYRPNPEKCCDACVFGRSDHAGWCCAEEAIELELLVRAIENEKHLMAMADRIIYAYGN